MVIEPCNVYSHAAVLMEHVDMDMQTKLPTALHLGTAEPWNELASPVRDGGQGASQGVLLDRQDAAMPEVDRSIEEPPR